MILETGKKYDVDALVCVGFTGDDEGYNYFDYFRDGVYLGPDADGIEPEFEYYDSVA